jgi:hypothetical protein
MDSAPAATSRTAPAPANAAVTSRFSLRDDSRVPSPA